MLARMAEMQAPATTNELTGDWSKAVVKVVSDYEAKPMEGVTVQLKGHIFNATDVGELSAKSNKDGVAKIGPIKAGQYEFFAWANAHSAHYTNFAFYPGRTNEITLVAPQEERPSGLVKFEVTCPDSLDKRDLVLAIATSRTDMVKLGTWNWSPPSAPQPSIDIDGKITRLAWNNELRQFQTDTTMEKMEAAAFPPGSYQIQSWRIYAIEPDAEDGKPRQLINFDFTSYSYSGFVPISFTVKSGETTQVSLDLSREETRRSYSRKSLQEKREVATREFLAKKKVDESLK